MRPLLHVFRHSRALARLALAWFVLSLGAAVASPLVNPQSMELICSGGAMKLLVKTDDGFKDARAASHTLDCPLCVLASAPPPSHVQGVPAHQPLARALALPRAAHIAALTAAPLSARAPPALHAVAFTA